MSTWKKASKVNQKVHRERQQLVSRNHLGFLEKKQDYKRRANHENQKKQIIKSLRKRALNKNPDEFYFKMINSKVINDVHCDKRKEKKHTPAQIQLMQTRDLKYINTRRTMEKKQIEKLKSRLHFTDKTDEPLNSHLYFVEEDEVEGFHLRKCQNKQDSKKQSFPTLNDDAIKKIYSKNKKMYNELEKRINREKELAIVQRKLEIKRALVQSDERPKRIKKATPVSAPIYKWKQERKK